MDGHVPVDGAQLHYRVTGSGPPIIVLHGGPDFDHRYLLPELDRLAGSFRLIYYDQRGRGRSADGVQPDDVTIASEVEDLERVRRHFGLESVAVLGHSWGGLLAMEYATRHADRLSHLILTNTAPGSAEDFQVLRDHLAQLRRAGEAERMQAIAATDRYQAGDIDAEADYYRLHFAPALSSPELLEQLVARLRTNVTAEQVLLARAIEHRLYDETFRRSGYDLVPTLQQLDLPTLVIHGEQDLIPLAVAARIAEAMPDARLSVLPRCGHFAFLEAPDQVHELVTNRFDHS